MQYDLVFKGGGAKGLAFVGAMREFERRNLGFRRIVGTSAGAITAVMLVAGYSSNELYEALNEKREDGKTVFSSFITPPLTEEVLEVSFGHGYVIRLLTRFGTWLTTLKFVPLASMGLTISSFTSHAGERFLNMILRNVDNSSHEIVLSATSIIEHGGLFSARNFDAWLSEKLADKDKRFKDATLASFYALTAKDISFVATDVVNREMIVLNHRTAPQLPLTWAVRMSMNIPFIWTPVVWQRSWGTYQGKSMVGHRIVDGGVLSNFAVRLTTSNSEIVRSVMGERPAEEVPTIGMLLDSNLPVPGAGEPPIPRQVIKWLEELGNEDAEGSHAVNLFSFTSDLAATLMEGNDNFSIAALKDSVCHLPVAGYDTLEFDMTVERREALIAAAQCAMQDYLDRIQCPIPDELA